MKRTMCSKIALLLACISTATVFSCFFAAGPVLATDAYTTLLVRSDSVNGGTAFTDASSENHAILPFGDTHHSTTDPKPGFGGTSIRFDGSGDFLYADDNDGWHLGDGDFTIDGWVNLSAYPYGNSSNISPFICHWQRGVQGGQSFYFGVMETQLWFVAEDAQGNQFIKMSLTGASLSLDTWHHVAVVRHGDRCTLYLDGTTAAVDDTAAGTFNNADTQLRLGAEVDAGGGLTWSRPFSGSLDEIRLSKGIARWTSDFTPAPAPYGTTAPLAVSGLAAIPVSGIAPLEVDFSAAGTGGTEPYSYSWDFGDGETNTLQNPTHEYTSPGSYTSQVVIMDADGNTVADTVTITVNPDTACGVHAAYDAASAVLSVPFLDVPLIDPITQQEIPGQTGVFSCTLEYVSHSGGSFSINDVTYLPGETGDDCHAKFDYGGTVYIPNVDVQTVIALPLNTVVQGPVETYEVTLKQLMLSPSYYHVQAAVLR